MPTTAERKLQVNLSGELEYSQIFSDEPSTSSPAQTQLVTLVEGDNTLLVPAGTTAIQIMLAGIIEDPVEISLKGSAGDTGIALDITRFSTIAVAGVTEFILTASASLVVRLFFT